MNTIAYKEDDEYVGLLVTPNNGVCLDRSELEKLKSYVKYVVLLSNESATMEMEVSDNGLYIFKDLDDNTVLDEIITICMSKLTEKLIVPQYMGEGPYIRHRPLFFARGDIPNSMVVKYSMLGDDNNLNTAFTSLNKIYPGVI